MPSLPKVLHPSTELKIPIELIQLSREMPFINTMMLWFLISNMFFLEGKQIMYTGETYILVEVGGHILFNGP